MALKATTAGRAVVGLLHYSHRSFPLLSNLHLTLVFLVRLSQVVVRWFLLLPGRCQGTMAASNQSLSSGRHQITVERRRLVGAAARQYCAAAAAAAVVECFSRQFFNVWLVSD